MQGLYQAKKLIQEAQNIMVLAPKNPGVDNLGSALSLSYTLNNSGKIVNFFPKTIPNSYSPLFPKKFIPKNFIISIQGKEISELYYEKENQILKIYLSSKGDKIEKGDIEFISLDKSPSQGSDLLVTVGIERLEKLGNFYENNFKLFYQTPILNIDNQPLNNKFGNVNLIFDDLPIAVISKGLIDSFSKGASDKDVKTWLLAGIIDFGQRKKINQEALENIFSLMEAELNYQAIIESFSKTKNPSQMKLLARVLEKIDFDKEKQLPLVCLKKEDFEETKTRIKDLRFVLEQLTNKILQLPSLLLLWESNAPGFETRGVFYSSDTDATKKILRHFRGQAKGKGIIFNTKERDINRAKERVLETI